MSDLGFVALSLALTATTYSFFSLGLGLKNGEERLVSSGKKGLHASTALLTLAILALLYSLVTRDFQVEYVASHTSRDLPLPYTISALWAGQEGILLFWVYLLSILASVVVLRDRQRRSPLLPYCALVMAGTQAFFLPLLIVVGNPFQTLDFVPTDGLGMNPLLQNPAMAWHPPMVFLGYVGFTVPLAFTLAVLISGRLKDPYVPIVRPWTLIAWLSLGLGTLLGARWSYVELGWGPYWAWDPAENTSLLPWLTATALVHSFMWRGTRVKISHIALAVATFALCIFGTFITRSGMISSVHAFSVSRIGLYSLAFLGLIIVASIALTHRGLAGLRSTEAAASLISRPSALLLTIVLLVAATAAILFGTLFPAISEIINVALTSDYFNLSTAVIVGPLILLMGICPFTTWRGDSLGALARYLATPFVGAVITGILLALLGLRDPLGLLAFSICSFVAIATLYQFFSGLRNHGAASDRNRLAALLSLIKRQRRRYGAYTVHLGIVFITMGVVGSSAYKTEDRVTLEPGSTHTIGSYTIRYDELSFRPEPGMDVATASLTILEDVTQVGILQPQKQFHHRTQQPVSEVAIRSTLREDLYVVLAGWEESTQTISLLVMVSPLIAWVWIGGAVVFAGSIIAIWPTRSQDVADQVIEEAIKRVRQAQGESAVEERPR